MGIYPIREEWTQVENGVMMVPQISQEVISKNIKIK